MAGAVFFIQLTIFAFFSEQVAIRISLFCSLPYSSTLRDVCCSKSRLSAVFSQVTTQLILTANACNSTVNLLWWLGPQVEEERSHEARPAWRVAHCKAVRYCWDPFRMICPNLSLSCSWSIESGAAGSAPRRAQRH